MATSTRDRLTSKNESLTSTGPSDDREPRSPDLPGTRASLQGVVPVILGSLRRCLPCRLPRLRRQRARMDLEDYRDT